MHLQEIEVYGQMILDLRTALEEAIIEIKTHNHDGSHVTDQEKIEEWENLL